MREDDAAHLQAVPDPAPAAVNLDAERALLGAILLYPDLAPQLEDHLEPLDFYEPKHELIWNAIYDVLNHTGVLPDAVTVAQHLAATGSLTRIGVGYIPDLVTANHSPTNAEHYAAIIRNAARLRVVQQLGQRLVLAAHSPATDVDSLIADALQDFDDTAGRIGPAHQALVTVPNIAELLAGEDDDTYDWVIPGLLERQERVIVTAEEGAGKSTLLRQIAMTSAAGIHPFTFAPMPPIRVLHVDVENSVRQSRRRYRPLLVAAHQQLTHDDRQLNPDNLRVEIRVQGLDLTTAADREWLTHTCVAMRPDLIVIGPIYKLANGDPTEEKSAKPVAMALDDIRARTDAALIVEAHVAKAPSGQKKRPHEPYGWSGWLRWPEIGVFLDAEGKVNHWRGAREERDWPTRLVRGGDFPWSPVVEGHDALWEQIRAARDEARRPVSIRDIVDRTGIPKSTVHRVINSGRYAQIWPAYNQNKNPGDDPR